jgi:hypothetical protein
MRGFERGRLAWLFIGCVVIAGCNEKSVAPNASSAQLAALRKENEQLKLESAALKRQVEELGQTPQVVLDKLGAAVQAQDVGRAKEALSTLERRFGETPQTVGARKVVGQLEAMLKEREAEAKRVAALGFYALKPATSTHARSVTFKVESIRFGKWTFDSYDDTYHYQDSQRGEKHLLLNATVASTIKDPGLPDVAVYRIEGKEMRRIAGFAYRFRRWEGHATYIGLYHDSKNDFAYSSAVAFNAGTVLSDEDATQPLAIVATMDYCHRRRQARMGRPEVSYEAAGCEEKAALTVDDFAAGNFAVLTFINRAKGS